MVARKGWPKVATICPKCTIFWFISPRTLEGKTSIFGKPAKEIIHVFVFMHMNVCLQIKYAKLYMLDLLANLALIVHVKRCS